MKDDAVARFVERLALLMAEAGMPRMPARVFVRLLATDSGQLTAPELAAALQVSPAAISGAVRYLDQVGMVTKGRDPGERRDHYQVSDATWMEAIVNRDKVLLTWTAVMVDGVDVLGPGTPAGERMAQSARFFEFLQRNMEELIGKWRAEEAARS